jgi:hypothetical protein
MRARWCRVRKLLAVGFGDAVVNRLRPAAHAVRAEGGLDSIAYLDLPARPAVELREGEHYLPVLDGSHLPLDALERLGFLDGDTLAWVATSTDYHGHYARQLRGHVRQTAVEKPLTCDVDEALGLLVESPSVHPISHFLFKQAMRDWRERCRRSGMPWLRSCLGIRVELMESKGVGRRRIDPVLFDLGWHGLELLLAPFRAAGSSHDVELGAVRVATYDPPPGEAPPPGTTAARLTGRLRAAGVHLPFDVCLGKGLGIDRKALVYRLDDGSSLRIDLSEGGWEPHERILRELLTAEQPDLGLALTDAAELVRLCALSQDQACDMGTYPFGTQPAFMREDLLSPSLLGLYY